MATTKILIVAFCFLLPLICGNGIFIQDGNDYYKLPFGQQKTNPKNNAEFDSRLYGDGLNFTINLNGTWKVSNSNNSIVVSALVPGNVHMDLLRAGIITEDPYYRYNDVLYRWIGLDSWTYSRSFEVSKPVSTSKKLLLVCEGLDTVATITINGQVIGTTENMFRRYIFDVSQVVQPGQNTISIAFESAATYAANQAAAYPYECPTADDEVHQHGEPFRNFIRKEQCTFSWDWGPCFIPEGIWQPIGIMAVNQGFITYVAPQIFGINGTGAFNVMVDTDFEAAINESISVIVSIDEIAGATAKVTQSAFTGDNKIKSSLQVSNVNLWWPQGYGDPDMYTLTVTVNDKNGNLIDSVSKNIGFRTVRIVTDPIPNQNGSTFYIEVNGIPVFAKGANWIPADSFENRVTYDVIRNILQSAADSNHNIVRNWGGGIYQHEAFYEICDELGLMIWEEFMFGCAMEPRNAEFLENVHVEIKHQVKRLMSHPSIVIWSGSNENEAALGWFPITIEHRDRYLVDFVKLYFDVVRETLILHDTSRPFWPSSPSNGPLSEDPYVGIWGNPGDPTMGDLHFYNYDMVCTDVHQLPNSRFVSEYGFQSFPSLYSWIPVSEPADWDYTSDLMNHRQHHADGMLQLQLEIEMHFSLTQSSSNQTVNFENWIYLTQCMQALCIQAESEHYRRSKSLEARTMGAIYWQLNDIWQAPSWASIEYGGRWKLLQYFSRRFFAPVLVSGFEYPYGNLDVHLTHDLTKTLTGNVYLSVWNYGGDRVRNETIPFSVPALTSLSVFNATIDTYLLGFCSGRNDCLAVLEAQDSQGNFLSFNVFYFSSLTVVTLFNPKIEIQDIQVVSSTQVNFNIVSQAVAPFVMVSTSISGRFSENGILLLPGQPMQMSFFGWETFTLQQFTNSVNVKSIYDTL